MALTGTERSRRCRQLQRSKQPLTPRIVALKVQRFLVAHPDQVSAVDTFMRGLAAKVRRNEQWIREQSDTQPSHDTLPD